MRCVSFWKEDEENLKILIDADGCPVTEIAVSAAERAGIRSVVYCDTSHDLSCLNTCNTEVIMVSKGADSADFALINNTEAGDIVVTQDYGLAAMALAKQAFPITQNGLIISDINIDSLLQSRHAAKTARRAGKHLKGPSKRNKKQDEVFLASLLSLIEANLT